MSTSPLPEAHRSLPLTPALSRLPLIRGDSLRQVPGHIGIDSLQESELVCDKLLREKGRENQRKGNSENKREKDSEIQGEKKASRRRLE